ASRRLPDGATVAALAVSNASGALVAADGTPVAGTPTDPTPDAAPLVAGTHTTLVVVASDATLDAAAARALATSAHAGIARVTRPSHTPFDGDTTFVLSTGARPAVDPTAMAAVAQDLVADAILRGARAAGAP
ncbi:MAG: P1 family peptidase, partial [Trueperaceae bacterium]|nr:P1 family peptidase [Trueperaceae bacterium]